MVIIMMMMIGLVCGNNGGVDAKNGNDHDIVMEWVRKEGGYIHPNITLQQLNGYGIAMVSNGTIVNGTLAIMIPSHLILHPRTILEKYYPDWYYLALTDEALVGLFLAVERTFGPTKRTKRRTVWDWWWNRTMSWQPYIQRLPTRTPCNVAHWRQRDFDWAMRVFGTAPDRQPGDAVYRVHLLESLFVQNSIPVTREDFIWGYAMAMSRTFEGGFFGAVCGFLQSRHHGNGGAARLDASAACTQNHGQSCGSRGHEVCPVSRRAARGANLS